MRWSVSAIAFAVACSSPPPAKPAAVRAHSCVTLAPACDPAIDDRAAAAIVHARCFACHDTNGIANHDFATLEALRAAPIAEMIGTCQMPPDGQAPLADADRRVLVGWSACRGR